ncbi:ATP-binding protein [Paenibacillus sp. OAS669]|uniref:sensor histidine kinase n=1 Tax=Paenibacillus sp. OAS669 TaxID=2663821 RepID=UPI00178BEB65|nr:HAMP domain-containing sensor histidine kinase [Paenibacillus sp. OAS669]MBE1442146.1 signal transduction histidine kinase [Paenibacillus sp. OAS669]
MSIRFKLLLSYAAMLIIPLILILMTTLLLVIVYRGDLQNLHDVYGSESIPFTGHQTERLMKELRRNTESNPVVFKDRSYLNEIAQELAANGSGLAVRKDEQLTYVSEEFEHSELLNQLPSFERAGHREIVPTKRVGNELYSIVQMDFWYADSHPGTVFILSKVSPFVNFARKFFPALFVSMLVILVVTNVSLTYFVSKSIIVPLRQLERAAKRIKEGDLDFQVRLNGRDEIAQLGLAFEEMRHQLQQSIQTQLQYEENRKELISNISHDLKTPLTAIQGYVAGIQDGVADTPDKMNKYIQTISSKAGEMGRLIDELFLYSKLDLKRLPFQFESVHAAAFLQDWAEELQFELDKKGILFETDLQVSPITQASIDRDKLKRVISNIMDNCVKYMDKPEKRIGLRAYEADASIVIEISDNGAGVAPEALPHIFDRFYRAEQSRNQLTGGSGLGLAIAKQIIDGHGGHIEAQSVLGQGTRITMTLPAKNK